MRNPRLGIMLLVAAIVPTQTVFGDPVGGTITSGDATLTFLDLVDNPGECELRLDGASSPSVMSRNWWWNNYNPGHLPLQSIGIPGDDPLPFTEEYTDNVATFTGQWYSSIWTLTYTLEDGINSGEAVLSERLHIHCFASQFVVAAIPFMDLDVGGTSGNDIATRNDDDIVTATDPETGAFATIEYDVQSRDTIYPGSWQLGNAPDMYDTLMGGEFLTLPDAESGFGPGDLGVGKAFSTFIRFNLFNTYHRTTTFCVPEPGTAGLLVFASLALLKRRR